MTGTVYLKVGDLAPKLQLTLTDDTTGQPVDLTAADTVTLVMSDREGTLVIDHRAMDVTDAAAGEVEADWQAGDTAEAGIYRAEVVVTWPGPRPQTFPSKGHLTVSVAGDLG